MEWGNRFLCFSPSLYCSAKIAPGEGEASAQLADISINPQILCTALTQLI